MNFTKMHGLGNDFVVVDCMRAAPEERLLSSLAIRVCDRHFGVGADGLILALPSREADFRMRILNADGSEAENCGNGIRCLAKFIYDRGHARDTRISVETVGRVNPLVLTTRDGRAEAVRVDMARPVFRREALPMTGPPDAEAVAEVLDVGGRALELTCVSMGNPHAVTFVDCVADYPVEAVGRLVECHPVFPRRTNTEFIEVVSPEEIRMRVWERGAGETLACGTGACASVVAGARTGRTGRRVTVHLRGGDLLIEWGEDDHIYMTGPAVEVFEGRLSAADLDAGAVSERFNRLIA